MTADLTERARAPTSQIADLFGMTEADRHPDDMDKTAMLIAAFAKSEREAAAAEAHKEIEWLRRLLQWCRARFRHAEYQSSLDKYIEAGPTDPPQGEPRIIQSVASLPAPQEET